ncbi:MAG TPA: multicopper oxidase domain-containing protein [Terriglobales bacterium]|nr:multicopper oxidase domain-containing protein [Terriglobales bacterium]
MARRNLGIIWRFVALLFVAALPAAAQSFRVQCPTSTVTHPPAPITAVSVSGTTVTVTSLLAVSVGDTITVAGIAPSGLDGAFTVASVPSSGTFTYIDTATAISPVTSSSAATVVDNNSEPTYNGPTQFNAPALGVPAGTTGDFETAKPGTANGAIKCQQISGGDGLSTMADGHQIFMFGFGPLSGLADVAAGRPSTQFPSVFNTLYPGCTSEANCASPVVRGDPATTDGATSGASPWVNNPVTNPAFTWNGAVGQMPDIANVVTVTNLVEGPVTGATAPGATVPGCPTTFASANTVTAWTDTPSGFKVGQQIVIAGAIAEGPTPTPIGYANNLPANFQGSGILATPATWTISCVATAAAMTPDANPFAESAFQYVDNNAGLAADTGLDLAATASTPPVIDGHVDPRQIMDVGAMNGNIPAPLSVIDEDDEFFLTLSNVGMIMRPDLFEQHTVHFHGYPNASSFYDGVPDASIAINIGASFTYYYLAPDAGTYFWHCHITPPEHLQMGMVGQIYVRPRQDRVPVGGNLNTYLGYQNGVGLPSGVVADLRTECNPSKDILCSATMPAVNTGATRPAAGTLCSGATTGGKVYTTPEYVYNDGDGSTCYDVVYPMQMHGFDPNFHFVGMTFNPELFVDMKDKYFLLNGRSYPDTVAAGPQATITTDGQMHYSQPLPAIINIPVGGKASLRFVNLSVSEYHTLESPGVPMHVVGWMAKLLRDQDGNNTEYWANSITLGGGEANDVILDASDDGCSAYLGTGCSGKLYPAGSTFYLYSSNLDHLSNDAENFGGMMTEIHICNSVSGPDPNNPSVGADTYGNVCN